MLSQYGYIHVKVFVGICNLVDTTPKEAKSVGMGTVEVGIRGMNESDVLTVLYNKQRSYHGQGCRIGSTYWKRSSVNQSAEYVLYI